MSRAPLVLSASNPRENKTAIAAVCKSLNPDYLTEKRGSAVLLYVEDYPLKLHALLS